MRENCVQVMKTTTSTRTNYVVSEYLTICGSVGKKLNPAIP
jgi:hypothetical protein